MAPGNIEHYRASTLTFLRLLLPHVEPTACAAAARAAAARAAAGGARAAAVAATAARHGGGRIFSTLANGELAKLV